MKSLIAAVVLVGIVLASTAGATTILGTVNMQNHNNNLSDSARLWGGGLNGGTYYTGIYSWTNAGGTDLGTQVPNWGFCIELTQDAHNGWSNVIPLEEAPLPGQYGTPMQTTKANYIRELWGRDFNSVWLTGGTTNERKAEAFSAAVWEIIYETNGTPATWDVTTGSGFRTLDVEQASLANTWLHQLNGDTSHFDWNLVATSSGCGQDYLVRLPTRPPPPAPEPATICLLGLGALSLIQRKK